jgi:peptidoglycan/xylan/chitin deacetylase (PgdA/CDA1 family)
MELKVVMYHYVHDEESYKYRGLKGISTEVLKNQINSLLDWGTPVEPIDLIDALYHSKKLPTRSFHLTFDDGLKDHYINVFPILKEYGLTASFFPITLPLIENKIPTVEKQRFVQYCFTDDYTDFLSDFYSEVANYRSELFKKLPKLTVENIKKESSYLKDFTFYSNEERFHRKIRDKLIPQRDFFNIINSLFDKYISSENSFINDVYMTKGELIEMQDYGMEIGGHTHTHAYLPNLSYKEQLKEIKKAVDFLNGFLNKGIRTYAYPFGAFNENTIKILKNLYLKYSFTTKNSSNNRNIQPFQLLRIDTKNLDCTL